MLTYKEHALFLLQLLQENLIELFCVSQGKTMEKFIIGAGEHKKIIVNLHMNLLKLLQIVSMNF